MTRAHRSLLILTAVTVLATGSLAQTLAGPAGSGADLQLVASLLILIASATLLVRVLRHLARPDSVRPDSAGPVCTRPGPSPARPVARPARPWRARSR